MKMILLNITFTKSIELEISHNNNTNPIEGSTL